MKYGIDWYKENVKDGGFLDDRLISAFLVDERNYSEQDIEQGIMGNFNAVVYSCYVRKNEETNQYYLVFKASAHRKGSISTLFIKTESEILYETVEETIELPRGIKSAIPEIRLIIPIKQEYGETIYRNGGTYDRMDYRINTKAKDSKEKNYKDFKQNYSILQKKYAYEDIILDSENIVIQYGYRDVVHGYTFIPIEGVEAYQKEDGTWTSDVVANPEKYLKSDLEWYYSDERMVDYIEAKGLLPQYKIDAIRAANYEDIFSLEYRLKQAVKILPIILFIIIVAVILLKKYKKKIFKTKK